MPPKQEEISVIVSLQPVPSGSNWTFAAFEQLDPETAKGTGVVGDVDRIDAIALVHDHMPGKPEEIVFSDIEPLIYTADGEALNARNVGNFLALGPTEDEARRLGRLALEARGRARLLSV